MKCRYIFFFLFLIGLQIQSSDNPMLSFHQKRTLISDQLADSGQLADCNLDFLARVFRSWNEQEIKQCVGLVKKIAQQNNPGFVMMRNFEVAIHELAGGSEVGSWHLFNIFKTVGQKYRHESAIHEAGHILAGAKNPFVIVLFGSIALRKNSAGLQFDIPVEDSPYSSFKETEMRIVQCMAGPVAEQVFNIEDSSFFSRLYQQLSLKSASKHDVELSLDELLNRSSAKLDMDQVRNILMSLVAQNVLSEEKVLQLLAELYSYTVKLVQDHKEEIKALAVELEQNTYVSSDKIYEICKLSRPKLDVER